MSDSFESEELHNLIDRIRAGDRDAANELIRRAGERLTHLARRMIQGFPVVNRWEQAEDVLQNAVQRLLKSLQEVKPDSIDGFFRFAATTIRRELFDLTRHYRGRTNLAANYESKTDGSNASPMDKFPAQAEDQNLERWAAFHQAVENLPDREKVIIELSFYEGLSRKEIAQVLEINEKTVLRRWNRATLRLVSKLGKEIPS